MSARGFVFPSSWQWPLATVCYLVILHLFALCAVPQLGFIVNPKLGFGVLATSILLVSVYLGWKAREPVCADVLIGSGGYIVLLEIVVGTHREYALAVGVCMSILGYGGAVLGRSLRPALDGPVNESMRRDNVQKNGW